MRLLREELAGKGFKSKRWATAKGTLRGGSALSRGALYTILKNRVYLGETVHKGKVYPGEHEAIIPEDLWRRVAALLANQRRKRYGNRLSVGHLLTGLLFDDRGHPMVPTHTSKGADKRYRYYTSRGLIRHEGDVGILAAGGRSGDRGGGAGGLETGPSSRAVERVRSGRWGRSLEAACDNMCDA